MPAQAHPPPPRRRRTLKGLALSSFAPAALAATAVLTLGPLLDGDGTHGSAAELARAAERPTLGDHVSSRALVQSRPALPPANGGARPAPPARISIPAAGVHTVVDAVGLRKGAIVVPGIGRAGWYRAGPRPGENGRAVVVGHLDTSRGPGLFARIAGLRRGSEITVTDRRGKRHRFRVVGGAQVEKARFPTESVYGGGRRPVLVLVTCGGPYVEGRGYRDNVLLYARAA